jgi:hypothetical protein
MNFPSRENIDRWLFDYTEGNLSAEQEEMLENYILNNPDLEVDLESWQGARFLSQEFILPNKENYKRKRRLAPFYIGSSLTLLLFVSVWVFYSTQIEHKQLSKRLENSFTKSQNNISHLKTESKIDYHSKKNTEIDLQFDNQKHIKNYTNTGNAYTKSSMKLNSNQFHFISNLDQTKRSQNTENPNGLGHSNSHQVSTDSCNSLSNTNSISDKSELSNSAHLKIPVINLKRIDSKSLKLNYYQKRIEEIEDNNEADNSNDGINLELGSIKIFQKIGKILEKDLGLSNIPDHTYSIPEYSNADVLFSNIGATSQFRFQSTSMARWIEDQEQRKLSQQITLDGYSRGAQSAFGLQANYDYFANGSIQNWNTCLMFSPKVAMTKSVSIEPALRFKIGNKLLNEDRITNHSVVNYESQIVNQFNFDSTLAIGSKLWYRDLDFGLTINTPYFYIGGQVSNILKHQNNIYSNITNMESRAKNVYNAIIGTQYISRNQKIQFSPYCFFERINTNRIFAGFSLKLNKFMIGGSYGSGKITSGTVGLSFKNFALYAQSSYGYANAINKNSFIHQLTIRFNSTVDKKSRRYITF